MRVEVNPDRQDVIAQLEIDHPSTSLSYAFNTSIVLTPPTVQLDALAALNADLESFYTEDDGEIIEGSAAQAANQFVNVSRDTHLQLCSVV